MSGTVSRADGSDVTGVEVTFINEASPNERFSDVTDEQGHYRIDLRIATAVQSESKPTPASSNLNQNYPNPFNPSTIISYSLATAGHTTIEIYNILGHRVITLLDNWQDAGHHSIQWDARDESARGVAAGVYFYRLISGHFVDTRKMSLTDGAVGLSPKPGLPTVVGIAAKLMQDQSHRFRVTITGPSIEPFEQTGVLITEDTTMDFVVASQPSPASTSETAMDNLERAFNERDKELYETLLDNDFWFTEGDCLGDLVFANGKEEELEIMSPRDGSRQGLFDFFRTIEYEFVLIERWTELGRDFPIAFEGDPDGHTDEDWEVFRGRVQILLLSAPDEGVRVDQNMNFKLRQGDDGLWRLTRWIDEPLSGDCAGKRLEPAAESETWGRIKASFSR